MFFIGANPTFYISEEYVTISETIQGTSGFLFSIRYNHSSLSYLGLRLGNPNSKRTGLSPRTNDLYGSRSLVVVQNTRLDILHYLHLSQSICPRNPFEVLDGNALSWASPRQSSLFSPRCRTEIHRLPQALKCSSIWPPCKYDSACAPRKGNLQMFLR